MEEVKFFYDGGDRNANFGAKLVQEIREVSINGFCILTDFLGYPDDEVMSQEVVDLNNRMRDEQCIKIRFKYLIHILKKCRTVPEMQFIVTTNKFETFELHDFEDSSQDFQDSTASIEFRLIGGELFTIFLKNHVTAERIKEFFSNSQN